MFWDKKHTITSFKGNTLNYSQVTNYLADIWEYLEKKGYEVSDVKLVYSVVTELLENVYRYSTKIDDNSEYYSFSIVELAKNKYQIKTCNPVNSEKALKLNSKIEFVNSFGASGLKKLYQYEIMRNKDDDHDGAGLGLIIIARKVNEPIKIELQNVTENITLVNLTATIKL